MSETTTQTIEKATQASGLGSLLQEVLEKRDQSILADFRKEILELSKPRHDRAPAINVEPGEGGEKNRAEPGPILSRKQPTDRLYEKLWKEQPEMRQCRTPDLDYWGVEWLRGLAERDHRRMNIARDKQDAILMRQSRATTLEGTLDVSDPTAILSGTGGHLLPQNMTNVVLIARDLEAVLAGLVSIYQMPQGKTLRIPTAGAVTSAMVAEGSTAAQGEPTFATELLDARKMQTYMKASVEMLADSPFNLMNLYAERAGTSMGALEDVQICTTNGTAPNISEAIAGGNVNEATSTVLIYEDLVTLFFALGKPYRRNAVWLGSTATLALCSKLMDGNDHPILSFPGVVRPVGDSTPAIMGTIFGRPVYEVPLADGTLLFGDVRQGYAFGRRSGIEASVSEHVDFASDLVNFKFTQRIDGRIVDDVAMKQMAGLATVA